MRERAPRGAVELLAQVVTDRGYVPDFLSPMTEDSSRIGKLVRTAPPNQVVEELGELIEDGRCDKQAVRRLAADPATTANRLGEAADALWAAGVAPVWPAMLGVLRADIRARTEVIGRDGFGEMVGGLHPTLTWTGSAICRSSSIYEDRHPPGRGLVLVPSIFGWPNVQTSTDPTRPPTLHYPARNATGDWARPPSPAVGELMGATRAQVLAHLDFPATTSDVAQALGLAVSTAHHHLRVLHATGLVDRHREGNAIWHLRTGTGDEIIDR